MNKCMGVKITSRHMHTHMYTHMCTHIPTVGSNVKMQKNKTKKCLEICLNDSHHGYLDVGLSSEKIRMSRSKSLP